MRARIVTQAEAAAIRARQRKRGAKIVFTNGCFDLIHSGHAVFLEKARKLGDFLIVGLNSDDSVRRLKGRNRPIMKFRDRALLLSYLSPVDLVVRFGEDTPLRLIKKLRPDILAKGADYRISEIVGADIVRESGGRVVRIPLVSGKSTTSMIERLIRRSR
jgi:D-beta-D-heptose 7-phosphate kinase/D-beta-D-heptose 1-phosphate adenosyltransferase